MQPQTLFCDNIWKKDKTLTVTVINASFHHDCKNATSYFTYYLLYTKA